MPHVGLAFGAARPGRPKRSRSSIGGPRAARPRRCRCWQNLEKKGDGWKDAAIAGGGGDQARTVLQARMAAGDPPTAMQMLGLVMQDWAEQGCSAT